MGAMESWMPAQSRCSKAVLKHCKRPLRRLRWQSLVRSPALAPIQIPRLLPAPGSVGHALSPRLKMTLRQTHVPDRTAGPSAALSPRMNVEPSKKLPPARPIGFLIRRRRPGVVRYGQPAGKSCSPEANTGVRSLGKRDNDPMKGTSGSNRRKSGLIRGNFQQTTFKSKRQG